jgi:superfamily II DNA helicase RecQ
MMANQIESYTSTFSLNASLLSDSPTASSSSTPTSGNDETSAIIARAIEQTFKFSPRPHQIKALQSLLDTKQDTILYAPTSAGKSLIAQAFPLFRPGWVLCIIPLTRLGEEQVNKLIPLDGLKGFLLYDKSNTADGRRELRDALLAQQCTHG